MKREKREKKTTEEIKRQNKETIGTLREKEIFFDFRSGHHQINRDKREKKKKKKKKYPWRIKKISRNKRSAGEISLKEQILRQVLLLDTLDHS